MISFEDIRKANETIKSTDIKGKEYAEVNQRIKAFRMVFPTGEIRTEIVSIKDGVCVMRAEARVRVELQNGYGEWVVLGTGTAYEKEGSSFINSTSYIENCETSAVGRALGMAGFGIDVSVASAEEVKNAMLNQGKDAKPAAKENAADSTFKPASLFQKTSLRKLLQDKPDLLGRAQKKYGLDFERLSWDEAESNIKRFTPKTEQEGA